MLALASCGLPDVEAPAVESNHVAVEQAPVGPADVTALTLPKPPAPLAFAMHSDAIRAIALTDDGSAAVSADGQGSVRLWPSLDGKHEPVVVAARPPATLALIRSGDSFVFAGLDNAGQLEVVQLSALGAPLARTDVALARPVTEVRAVAGGFLALRDDGWIVGVDAAGRFRGDLRPDAQEHVSTLAVRKGAALALVERRGKVRGRWIDVAALSWGRRTPVLAIDGRHAALGPDHARIAATADGGRVLTILDLATGKESYRPISNEFVDSTLRPLGFTTDDTLAFASGGNFVQWWTDGIAANGESTRASAATAVADGVLVGGDSGGLRVDHTDLLPPTPKFLGYRLTMPTRVRPITGGWLATDGRHVVAIDDHLATRRAYELAAIQGSVYGANDVRFVDDDHVIAGAYNGSNNELDLLSLEHRVATRISANAGVVAFDDKRGVLVYREGNNLAFTRYDRNAQAFGPVVKLAIDERSLLHVAFADPRDASALAVVVTSPYGYGVAKGTTARITPIHELTADGRLELGTIRTVPLTAEWWRTNGGLDTLVTPAPARTPSIRWASPSGTLVAEQLGGRLTLRGANGSARWTVLAAGISQLAWRGDDHLFAIGAGMAQLDLATGDVSRAQCGWSFGLWDEALELGNAQMCEQF